MKCPGQDSRYWKPGAIFEVKCPHCGSEVEFFQDDTTRKCKSCGNRFINPGMDFGCASYCQYAEQCIGDLPPELIAERENLLKDRAAIEVKRYFRQDFKRIGHAVRVARYAEEIGKDEGGNLAVILMAAYLHDIGIKEAERKHQGSVHEHHEREGVPVARELLNRLKAPEELIDEVCDIVGRHHVSGAEASTNFKCVYDADRIANLEERKDQDESKAAEMAALIKKSLLTVSGRNLAAKILLSPGEQNAGPTAGTH